MKRQKFEEDYGVSPSEAALREKLDNNFNPALYGNAGGEKAAGTQELLTIDSEWIDAIKREGLDTTEPQHSRKEKIAMKSVPMAPVDYRALHGGEGMEQSPNRAEFRIDLAGNKLSL